MFSRSEIFQQASIFELKKCGQLRIGDQRFAAKMFFNIGQGPGKGLEANQVLLIRDLLRLKRLALFQEKFTDEARAKSAPVAGMYLPHIKNVLLTYYPVLTEFSVSDTFIIIVHKRGNDVSGKDLNAAYLVEPLRSTTTVQKFSGTFGSSAHTDKTTATMSAFAHFILADTACSLAFTDLQGVHLSCSTDTF